MRSGLNSCRRRDAEVQRLRRPTPSPTCSSWEYTGFPAFWFTDDASEECRAKVRTVLNENLFAWQTQFPPPERGPEGPSVWERLRG